ncbi:DotH/IcmK family type IV secretion protein [Piscirickettsia litoralis]|uniref:DotH/IcmK family type IV secretion protein n=1 Tax=Piscirickettsia litoralis TaxID=1891921 RepID=UPI002286C239|nr:DotH/IcmK family type IV secretion protein [Piscirickettsia litoralis]
MSTAAFNQLTKNDFPLKPSQIHQYKNLYDAQQKAESAPAGDEPRESSSSIIPVGLQPGGVEPIVRVAKGMISSIVMTDQSGKVWPISSYSLGDPENFNIQWNKASGVLMVQGLKAYGQANIGIMLKGLDIPVMLSLVLGQKNVGLS